MRYKIFKYFYLELTTYVYAGIVVVFS